jgi:hypothetical protein
VRDAVKRALPKDAPKPASVKKAEKANGGAAPAAAEAKAEG